MATEGEDETDTWTCPRCTLTNDDDARLCSVCGCARSLNNSRGKGGVLRPRAAHAPPPMVSTFAEQEAAQQPNQTQNGGEDDTHDDAEDDPQGDAQGDAQDDAEEVDEPVPIASVRRSTRNKRARGREAKGKGARGSRNGSGSSNDSVGSGAEGDNVSAAWLKTTVPTTEAASGALEQPVELDDSDQQSDSPDGSIVINDEDDISGENPLLFGRGWGVSTGYNGSLGGGHNRLSSVLASAAGGAPLTRRGKKRQRALPSCSGDDIFRSRKYAGGEGSGSDGGGQPLTIRRSVGFAGGMKRPFWRWPPTPASALPARAGDEAVCGEVEAEKEQGMAHSKGGDCVSGVTADGLGASGAGGGGGGGSEGDALASQGSCAIAGDSTKQLAQEPSVPQSQQQARKSQKKRSRLSLPRKQTGSECKDENNTPPPSSQPAETDHPPPQPTAEGHKKGAGLERGDATPGLEEASGERANRPRRGGAEGGGVSERDTIGAAGDGSTENMDVDSPCGRGVDVRSAETDGGSDVRGENDAEERVGEERGAGRQVGGPPTSTEGGSKHGTQQSARGCASIGGGGAVGEARMGGASTVVNTGTGAIASTVRVAPRTGMSIDFGDDSDSDSSDDDDAKTQSDTNRDGGVAHLGPAMDKALGRPSQESASAPSSSSSVVPSPAAAPPTPTPATGVTGADLNGNTSAPSHIEGTPPRRKPGGKGKAWVDDSPGPSSTGLVDTPPPIVDKAAGVLSAAGAGSTRKSLRIASASRVTRAGARLASSPGFSAASLSQSPPHLLGSPAAAAGGSVHGSRGEWKCGVCTLLNRARAKKCVACGIGHPPSSTSAKVLDLDGAVKSEAVDDGDCQGNADADPDPDPDGGHWQDGFTADDDSGVDGVDLDEPSDAGSGDAHTTGGVSHGLCDVSVGGEDVEAAGGEKETADLAESEGKGFVGDVEAILSESEGDDEDYDEDRGSDEDWEESEMVASQIEEKFHRSHGGQHQSRRSTAASSRPADDVLDLTDAVEEHQDARGAGGGRGAGKGTAKSDGEFSVEDISDDDEFEVGHPSRPGALADDDADGVEDHWDAAEDNGQYPPAPKKFPFFSSVTEHLNEGSSCVDFASMAEAPAGGAPGTKSYDARKRARDRKPAKSGKRGKKAKKPRTTTASARGRGSARGGRASRGTTGRGVGSRSGTQPFGGGGGGGPSSSWIPQGVAANSASATPAVGRRNGGSAGGRGAVGQRQPFNHYRGNDEMVDDSNGGGGSHWEHVGMSSFGD